MIDKFKEKLSSINRIQPLTPVVMDLLEAIQSDVSEAEDLRRIIESDANVSVTVLKLANSPFYGMSGRIKNVKDACVLLGFNQLQNIVYTTALEHAANRGPHPIWRKMLRQHALATAVICNVLAIHKKGIVETNLAYPLGLLHELGKQIVMCELPDTFESFMATTETQEEQEYNVFFTEVGLLIAEKWHLPDPLKAGLLYSQSMMIKDSSYQNEISLVYSAHQLAFTLGFPSPGCQLDKTSEQVLESYCPELDKEAVIDIITKKLGEYSDLDREPVT